MSLDEIIGTTLSITLPTLLDRPIVPFSTEPAFPPNSVALLSFFERDHQISYYLTHNRHEMIIHTPSTVEGSDGMAYGPITYWLEILQNVMHTVEWGRSNRGVLIKSKKRGYVVECMPPKRKFSLECEFSEFIKMPPCPIWAPYIKEEEILVTTYGEREPFERRGMWKDHRLDIHYAYDDTSYYLLNRTMWPHRMLEGRKPKILGDVVGHIVNSAGVVIGIATEAVEGRALTSSAEDRAKIYETVAAIQSWGFIYHSCLDNKFIILNDGSVRLTEVYTLQYVPDRAQRERMAERRHWASLEELFFELSITQWGPYGWCRTPPSRLTSDNRNKWYLTPPVSPERPLGSIEFIFPFFERSLLPLWPGYVQNPDRLWGYGTEKDNYRRARDAKRQWDGYQKRYILGVVNAEDDVLEELSIIPRRRSRTVSQAQVISKDASPPSRPGPSKRTARSILASTADLTGNHAADQALFVGDFDSDGETLQPAPSAPPPSSSRSSIGQRKSGCRGDAEAGHSGSSQLRQRSDHRSQPSFHPYAMHSSSPLRAGTSPRKTKHIPHHE